MTASWAWPQCQWRLPPPAGREHPRCLARASLGRRSWRREGLTLLGANERCHSLGLPLIGCVHPPRALWHARCIKRLSAAEDEDAIRAELGAGADARSLRDDDAVGRKGNRRFRVGDAAIEQGSTCGPQQRSHVFQAFHCQKYRRNCISAAVEVGTRERSRAGWRCHIIRIIHEARACFCSHRQCHNPQKHDTRTRPKTPRTVCIEERSRRPCGTCG